MGRLTNYAATQCLNHVFNAAYTNVSTLYLALCTADPTDTATGSSCNEVADASAYARTAISFGVAAARVITQDAQVTFPLATGAWGAVTHWCIVDNAGHGLGNALAYGAFNSSFAPVAGNTPYVPTAEVAITIDAISGYGATTYLANELLSMLFDDGAFASTAGNTFIGLFNVALSDASEDEGDVTEISGTAYARVEVNPTGGSSPTWTAVAARAITNAHDVVFPTVGAGNWTQMVAAAIVDSSEATFNVLFYDNTNVTDQTPLENDIVQILAGSLDVSLT